MAESTGTRKFLIDATALGSSTVVRGLLRLLQGGVVARLLTPELYGVYSLFNLMLFYSRYAHLGLIDGASRELMFAAGRGDETRMVVVRNTAFTGVTGITLLLTVGFVLGAIFLVDDGLIRFGLVMAAVQTMLLRTYHFFDMEANVRRRFVLLSRVYVPTALVGAVLAVGGTYFWGVRGLIAGIVITHGFQLALLAYRVKIRLGFGFAGREALSLWRIGFPMMTSSIAWWLLRFADKTMVAVMLSTTALGFYAFATFVNEFLVLGLRNLAQVLTPHFLQTYAREGTIQAVKGTYERFSRLLGFTIPAVLASLVLVIDYPINTVLDQYVPSLEPAKILIGSTFFIGLAGPPSLTLIALNRQTLEAGIWWSALAVNVVANYLVISLGGGLSGVAAVTLFSHVVACLLLQVVASGYYHSGIHRLRFLAGVYLPGTWALGWGWAALELVGDGADLATTALRLVMFWAGYGPVLLWGLYKLKLLGRLSLKSLSRRVPVSVLDEPE